MECSRWRQPPEPTPNPTGAPERAQENRCICLRACPPTIHPQMSERSAAPAGADTMGRVPVADATGYTPSALRAAALPIPQALPLPPCPTPKIGSCANAQAGTHLRGVRWADISERCPYLRILAAHFHAPWRTQFMQTRAQTPAWPAGRGAELESLIWLSFWQEENRVFSLLGVSNLVLGFGTVAGEVGRRVRRVSGPLRLVG